MVRSVNVSTLLDRIILLVVAYFFREYLIYMVR
jgi:hypothetical protein